MLTGDVPRIVCSYGLWRYRRFFRPLRRPSSYFPDEYDGRIDKNANSNWIDSLASASVHFEATASRYAFSLWVSVQAHSGHFGLRFFVFAHRARTALRAASLRCFAVIFAARLPERKVARSG
jgi:hypothetical protein